MRPLFAQLLVNLVLAACSGNPAPHDVASGPVQRDSSAVSYPAPLPASPAFGAGAPGMHLEEPAPYDTLRSPAAVHGEARGSWYFEGQFPMKLYDSLNRLLALVPVRAGKDWTNDDYVPFSGILEWKKYSGKATLVLESDNPSGDEKRAKRYPVAVWLMP